MNEIQISLLNNASPKIKEEINALNEMFSSSRRYRNSKEYMEMLRFITRFPKYSPYNCFILQIQNPSISYVATAKTWKNKFERIVKHDARPLVIIAPMQPVLFVYDLTDTEGKKVPEHILRPFNTVGQISESQYHNTVLNAKLHGITIIETNLELQYAGSAIKLYSENRNNYSKYNIDSSAKYLVLINKSYYIEDKYSSLVHELAHIFCGHIGIDEDAWWKNRSDIDKNAKEIEAESVSYLVCERKGLVASSDKYLCNYKTPENLEIPNISLSDVFQTTYYIEEMSKSEWKKPLKKSIYKQKIQTDTLKQI